MNFIEEFIENGYFYQATEFELLKEKFNHNKIIAYVGFDCTAQSLHIGHLTQIMALKLLQKYGHKPIIVIGGATTKIGDPSGKNEMRKLVSDNDIAQNIKGIKKSLSKFLNFGEGENDALLLNNQEWLNKLNYIDFLRDYGKLFSVNRMISMDSVKSRLSRDNSHLSFLEFNYMILQSYDFYHLNKYHGCNLQIGGSDQWGNIVMGVDLIKRRSKSDVFGVTTPLLTTSTGAKMGKTATGAIWLNSEMDVKNGEFNANQSCSIYDYFQYWRNMEDDDIIRFAKLYGEFSKDKINDLHNLATNNINKVKQIIAHKITMLCHGKEEADKALNTAIQIFKYGNFDDNLPKLTFTRQDIENHLSITELLVKAELTSSKSEGKKLISNGGVKINGCKLMEEHFKITKNDFIEGVMRLSLGKKKHFLVKIIE